MISHHSETLPPSTTHRSSRPQYRKSSARSVKETSTLEPAGSSTRRKACSHSLSRSIMNGGECGSSSKESLELLRLWDDPPEGRFAEIDAEICRGCASGSGRSPEVGGGKEKHRVVERE